MCQARRLSVVLVTFGGFATALAQNTPPPAPPAPEVVWRYAPEPSNFDQVVVHDGVVFALDRGGPVHAIDALAGKPLWVSKERMVCDRVFGLTLAKDGAAATVIVGCDKGLFAFRASDGEKLWGTEIAAGVAGPAVAKGIVVAGGADGRVYGFDLKTGEIRWQHDYLEDRPDDPPGFRGGDARFSEPARPGPAATDGEMVALSIFDQCRTLAMDPVSGKRLWDFRTEGWMYGRPAFGPLYVYVGSQDTRVYAVDKQIGKLAWKVETKERNEGAVAVTDRFVYCGSCDGNLRAIDTAVGRVAWTFPIELAADRTNAIYACPIVLGDSLHFAAMEGTVYALHRETGKLQWQLRPAEDAQICGDLATDGERLFVVTRQGPEKGQSAVLAIRRP